LGQSRMDRWSLDLASEQSIVGLVGDRRDALSGLAYLLARHWDPEYRWVTFPGPEGSAETDVEQAVHRRTASARWMSLVPDGSLGPDEDSARDAIVLRSLMPQPLDDSDALRFDLYRIPAPLRRLAVALQQQERATVAVLANIDRLAHLYPDDPEVSRRYFRAGMGERVTLIVTFCGPLRRNRNSADCVLLSYGSGDSDLRAAEFQVERADMGPFSRDRSPFRLGDVPGIDELLPEVHRAGVRRDTPPP
jgi:hypothetical protein